MFSSLNIKNNIVLTVYNDIRTVFRLKDIALMLGETNFQPLNKKLNYFVRTGKLQNPRKGIYAKPDYNTEELACTIYTPSYISLEYVLQKAGIVFQYDSRITVVSYLSRTIDVSDREYKIYNAYQFIVPFAITFLPLLLIVNPFITPFAHASSGSRIHTFVPTSIKAVE